MAQNVTIAGVSYNDVPSIDIPKTGGGIVKFYDVSGISKEAATVAPSTSEQIVCASGVYTTGEQKVSAITPSIVGNLDASSFAASIVSAIEGKGVTVPDGTLLDGMAALINSIEAGGGGGFQVALGTFTPAETKALNSLPPVSIEHNAGFTPDVFIFYNASTGTYGMIAISAKSDIFWGDGGSNYSCYVMCKGASSMGEGSLKSFPLTGEVAYIRSNVTSHKVTAGQEYRWIAIGGI